MTPQPAPTMLASRAKPGDQILCDDGKWDTIRSVSRLGLHAVEIVTVRRGTMRFDDCAVTIRRSRKERSV